MSTEIGYGFNVLDESGKLTAFGGINQYSGDQSEILVGMRMNFDSQLKIDLIGSQRVMQSDGINNRLKLSVGYSW